MTEFRIRAHDWVVVCDGRKALILENVGDSLSPRLETKEAREQKDAPTREMGTDAPPRVMWPASGARSTIEQTDWHDLAEREFLEGLAERLSRAVTGGEAERLIMIAPPRALGVLRKAYSPALQKAIGAEIEKDYTRMPVREIERHLAASTF